MALLKGKDLMIYVKDKVVGYATSCDLDIQTDTKEITAGTYKHIDNSGQWKEYEASNKGWSCNSDYVIDSGMTDVLSIFDTLCAGAEVDIKFGIATLKTATPAVPSGETGSIEIATGAKGFKGKGIITSIKISAQDENDCTYSISIQGTGALSKN